MSSNPTNLVWIDLEMTGLNAQHDRIIEIASIITDSSLNTVAEGPVIAIHQQDALLDGMDDWNTKQHNGSGLVERVKQSQISEAEAEQQTLEFIKKYASKGKALLCGNSIWQDRRFLERYMPELEQYFHYRMIDVSTIKELALRWKPEIYNGLTKESKHLALEDIRESINELKYYRDKFFNLT